jgi:hypothetical protein
VETVVIEAIEVEREAVRARQVAAIEAPEGVTDQVHLRGARPLAERFGLGPQAAGAARGRVEGGVDDDQDLVTVGAERRDDAVAEAEER